MADLIASHDVITNIQLPNFVEFFSPFEECIF